MRRLLAAEARKLLTTRLWLWLLAGSVALVALYTALNIQFDGNPVSMPLETPGGQRTLFSIASGAGPLIAVLGAVGMAGEFRHLTATQTFLTTPDRLRVLAAKVGIYAIAGAGYGLVCAVVVVAIAVPWLAARGLVISVLANGIPGVLAASVLVTATYAVIGVALGALLRDQVAAITGLLAYLFLVEPVVTQIGAWRDWTVYLPGPAEQAFTQVALLTQRHLDVWVGGLAFTGYAVALVCAGALALRRRDIA